MGYGLLRVLLLREPTTELAADVDPLNRASYFAVLLQHL